jgi:DNA-binding response OmpR family regulator
MKILVVDDEPMLLKIITRLFGKLQCDVETAEDEQKAMEIFRKNPNGYELVILDYMLNNMPCEPILRQMKEINPNLRVVLTTGYAAEDKRAQMADLGVVASLQKPFTFEDLEQLLKKLNLSSC